MYCVILIFEPYVYKCFIVALIVVHFYSDVCSMYIGVIMLGILLPCEKKPAGYLRVGSIMYLVRLHVAETFVADNFYVIFYYCVFYET